MRRVLLVLLAAALLVTGGSAAVASAAGDSSSATAVTSASARSLFRSNCGRCHTLAAAGTTGGRGPNLDRQRLTRSGVSSKIRRGGGGMPSFSGKISSRRITAIARYVVRVSKAN